MTPQQETVRRLGELGLVPAPAKEPPGWMTPVNCHANMGYLSGQVAFGPSGELIAEGRLGDDVSLDIGIQCARQAAANAIAVLERSLGDLGLIAALQKLTVFVACTGDFRRQPEVANGASEVLYAVMQERGRHARSAIGVAALPLGSPVEIELSFVLAKVND